MKTIRQYQNLFICSTLLFFANSCIEPGYSRSSDDSFMKHTVVQTPPQANQGNNIKLALLLDTSSSMDGLIEQAKSQLWEIVNTLALAKKAGNYAELEIALYQYGNSGLLSRTGYIEKVLPLTNDLDEISNQLFNLTTNGGDEYCGAVISAATKELTWNEISSGLNLIFIVLIKDLPITEQQRIMQLKMALLSILFSVETKRKVKEPIGMMVQI